MLTSSALLAAAAFFVGAFIGAVGVGGILLIPAVMYFAEAPIHTAAATVLFTFGFTGMLGTWLYQRRGSIDWRTTIPICLGAGVFSVIGAWVNSQIDARPLGLVIAAIILASGAYILVPVRNAPVELRRGLDRRKRTVLLVIGAASGFGSGLSGAGGPLFSVPLMIAAGFAPLTAIGSSQVLQIIAALLGTAGHVSFGTIDFALAAWIAAFEMVGVIAGFRIAHAMNANTLRQLAAVLCVIAGGFMLARQF